MEDASTSWSWRNQRVKGFMGLNGGVSPVWILGTLALGRFLLSFLEV